MSHTRNTNDYLNAENTERFKLQAPSSKPQAEFHHNGEVLTKRQARNVLKHQANQDTSRKHQAPSNKPQA